MNLLCVNCVWKNLLDYTNLFSLNEYKKNEKIIISILKINMVEEASFQFRLRNRWNKKLSKQKLIPAVLRVMQKRVQSLQELIIINQL